MRVTVFNSSLQAFSEKIIDTMHNAAGIGIAAQQVGEAVQLCVVDLRKMRESFDWEFDGAHLPLNLFMPLVVVNPKIQAAAQPTSFYEEGCLSFPGIRGDVERAGEITIKFQDLHSVPHVLRCNGLLARCIQHEVDHLNGVLFIDRMGKSTLARIGEALKALKKQTRDARKR